METETEHSDKVTCCPEEAFCTAKNVLETLELFSWLCVLTIPVLLWVSGSSVSNDVEFDLRHRPSKISNG